MVILNEKDLVPPPPYFAIEHNSEDERRANAHSLARSASSTTLSSPSLSSQSQSRTQRRGRNRMAPPLPSHILLLIVYSTLPLPGESRFIIGESGEKERRRESAAEMAVRTTRTLYWMAFCLRAVNRGFYLASMHILRSTFLPYYMQNVRSPYTSDPFPHSSVAPRQHQRPFDLSSGAGSVVSSTQCESSVLDLYILHQLHEDVFADDSSLHTSRPERLRDLFDFMQPRARLMDLVRAYGVGAGLLALDREEEEGLDNYEEKGREEERDLETQKTKTQTLDKSLKSKLARSTSTLTLINPIPSTSSLPPPSPFSASRNTSQIKLYSSSSSYHPPSSSPYYPNTPKRGRRNRKIPYTALRISFSPRRLGLVYTPPSSPASRLPEGTSGIASGSSSKSRGSGSGGGALGAPRTIVDIAREREEPLERSASRLVAGLKAWMDAESELNSRH